MFTVQYYLAHTMTCLPWRCTINAPINLNVNAWDAFVSCLFVFKNHCLEDFFLNTCAGEPRQSGVILLPSFATIYCCLKELHAGCKYLLSSSVNIKINWMIDGIEKIIINLFCTIKCVHGCKSGFRGAMSRRKKKVFCHHTITRWTELCSVLRSNRDGCIWYLYFHSGTSDLVILSFAQPFVIFHTGI